LYNRTRRFVGNYEIFVTGVYNARKVYYGVSFAGSRRTDFRKSIATAKENRIRSDLAKRISAKNRIERDQDLAGNKMDTERAVDSKDFGAPKESDEL